MPDLLTTAILTRPDSPRQQAMEELRESERRFREMLSHLALVSMMLDRKGRITYCNDYLLLLAGWQRDEVMGRDWFELFLPLDVVDELREGYASLLADEPVAWHYENEIVTRSGERRLMRWNNSLLRSVCGEVIGTASIGEDVTERKRSEAALTRTQKELSGTHGRTRKQAEDERNRFFALSRDMLCILGFDGYYKDLNSAWEATLGYTDAELLAKPFIEFVHPDDRQATLVEAEKLTGGNAMHTFENRYRCKDGSYRNFLWSATPVVEDGLIYGAARDVTDRKHAEEAPGKAGALRSSIFSSANFSSIATDAKGVIQILKVGAERMLGFTAGEVVNKITPADIADPQEVIIRTEALSTELGIPIAPRFEAESETRYRTLFEYAPDGIVISDPEGYYLDANASMCRMLGYTRDELVRLNSSEIVAPDEIQHIRAALRTLNARNDYHREWQFRRKDGSIFSADVIVTTMPDGNFLGMIRDITERKRAEEAIRSKNEELTTMTQQLWQASKLATMGELAASVAHELNNPLATVGLRTENLLMQLAPDSDQRRPLEIIAQEVDRMATLVSNLLLFSRRNHRQVSTVDVAEEVVNSVECVHYHLRNRNIEVVREFPDTISTMQADRQQLRQLFLNLLTNASDAMPQGGKLIVGVTSNGSEGTIAIDFADTGQGITRGDLEKIWEPFYSTKPEGKGTGLGLAICRRIVEEHGGTIDIRSERGQGTTVRIVLPASDCDEDCRPLKIVAEDQGTGGLSS